MQDKDSYQAELFRNRLTKNLRTLRKWARRSRVTCYRLYDRDIPEVPLACDLYTFVPDGADGKTEAARLLSEENALTSGNGPGARAVEEDRAKRTYLHLYLYERPYEKPEAEEERWLSLISEAAAEAVGIPSGHVIRKTRRRQSADAGGKRTQYQRTDAERTIRGIVQEQGQLFLVNLTDYIDTGLFLDHRPLREHVRASSRGKRVLNLFCYTASFSVYAAEGGAASVESVDMSNTYTDWARENLDLNGFTDRSRYPCIREDADSFISARRAAGAKYDMIILDPPTFSNSKRMTRVLDINRDWPDLAAGCLDLLAPGGTLYFSTNSRRLSFSAELLPRKTDGSPLWSATDITARTIPEDFRNTRIHRAWAIEEHKPPRAGKPGL